MPKSAQEVLLGLVRRAYNLTEQGVAELQESEGQFKDEALDKLLQMDADRVATIKGPDMSVRLTEKFQEGERRAAEKLEKDLMAEFNVKASDKKGIELIKHIVHEKLAAANTALLDDDKVKLHPLYRKVEEQVTKFPSELEAALKAKEEELRAELDADRNANRVAEAALEVFRSLRPKLSPNPQVAKNQERDFLEKVKSGKYQVSQDADGKLEIVPLRPDGKSRLENAHNHPVPFEELIGNLTRERFDLQVAEDKDNAPPPDGVGGNKGGEGSVKLASKDAYFKAWGEIEEKYRTDPKTMQAEHAKLKETAKEQGVLS